MAVLIHNDAPFDRRCELSCYAPFADFVADNCSEEPSWIVQQFAKTRRLPLRFYSEPQRYDAGFYGADILAAARHMRDLLRLKGYRATHREFNSGHDGYTQRGSVAGGLMALPGHTIRAGKRVPPRLNSPDVHQWGSDSCPRRPVRR